jgi:hypothetical protein
MKPHGYHLTNNLLHSLNAALFFRLAVALIEVSAPRPSRSRAPSLAVYAAAFAAAILFAVHPLRVESVAWVTERRDVLSGFFFLGFLLAYVAADAARGTQSETGWRRAALAGYALSLLSKATGVTAPLVLIAPGRVPRQRLAKAQRLSMIFTPPDSPRLVAIRA